MQTNCDPQNPEVQAWNQMMSSMITFISASTQLMHTLNNKIVNSQLASNIPIAGSGAVPQVASNISKKTCEPCGVTFAEDLPRQMPASSSAIRQGAGSARHICTGPCGPKFRPVVEEPPKGVVCKAPCSFPVPSSHTIGESKSEAISMNHEQIAKEELDKIIETMDIPESVQVVEDRGEDQAEDRVPSTVPFAVPSAVQSTVPSQRQVAGVCNCVQNRSQHSVRDRSQLSVQDRSQASVRDRSQVSVQEGSEPLSEPEAVSEPEAEVEPSAQVPPNAACSCPPSHAENAEILEGFKEKLARAEMELQALQREMGRLNALNRTNRPGMSTTNTAALYQQIMKDSVSPSRMTAASRRPVNQTMGYSPQQRSYPQNVTMATIGSQPLSPDFYSLQSGANSTYQSMPTSPSYRSPNPPEVSQNYQRVVCGSRNPRFPALPPIPASLRNYWQQEENARMPRPRPQPRGFYQSTPINPERRTPNPQQAYVDMDEGMIDHDYNLYTNTTTIPKIGAGRTKGPNRSCGC